MHIVTYDNDPQKVLKKISQPVEHFDSELKDLVNELTKILKLEDKKDENLSAVGLAAPQIGVSKNIFLSNFNDQINVYINPQIKPFGKEKEMLEGCLSFPNIYIPVTRPSDVKIKYYDEKGKKQRIRASDFLARIIQHEHDHLTGKILADQKAFKEAKKIAQQSDKKLEEIIEKLYGEDE